MIKIETVIQIIIAFSVVTITLLVGFYVMNDISRENWVAVGFCLDKDGIYDITEYNYEFDNYDESVNCSNKERPIMMDTALAGY